MDVLNGKEYKYAIPEVIEDEEANKKVVWEEQATFINAYIYPASGQVQAEQYGKDLPYIKNLLTNDFRLKEGYGLMVDSDQVDYAVISVKKYTGHLLCEIKKL